MSNVNESSTEKNVSQRFKLEVKSQTMERLLSDAVAAKREPHMQVSWIVEEFYRLKDERGD